MYRFRIGIAFASLLCIGILSGCATKPPQAETEANQRAAMESWKSCLSRHADVSKPPAKEAKRLINYACEGHRRDVIAQFPPHLGSKIDAMLKVNAYRYIGVKHDADTSASAGLVLKTLSKQ